MQSHTWRCYYEILATESPKFFLFGPIYSRHDRIMDRKLSWELINFEEFWLILDQHDFFNSQTLFSEQGKSEMWDRRRAHFLEYQASCISALMHMSFFRIFFPEIVMMVSKSDILCGSQYILVPSGISFLKLAHFK